MVRWCGPIVKYFCLKLLLHKKLHIISIVWGTQSSNFPTDIIDRFHQDCTARAPSKLGGFIILCSFFESTWLSCCCYCCCKCCFLFCILWDNRVLPWMVLFVSTPIDALLCVLPGWVSWGNWGTVKLANFSSNQYNRRCNIKIIKTAFYQLQEWYFSEMSRALQQWEVMKRNHVLKLTSIDLSIFVRRCCQHCTGLVYLLRF